MSKLFTKVFDECLVLEAAKLDVKTEVESVTPSEPASAADPPAASPAADAATLGATADNQPVDDGDDLFASPSSDLPVKKEASPFSSTPATKEQDEVWYSCSM